MVSYEVLACLVLLVACAQIGLLERVFSGIWNNLEFRVSVSTGDYAAASGNS
jgi:hypothetical protein